MATYDFATLRMLQETSLWRDDMAKDMRELGIPDEVILTLKYADSVRDNNLIDFYFTAKGYGYEEYFFKYIDSQVEKIKT